MMGGSWNDKKSFFWQAGRLLNVRGSVHPVPFFGGETFLLSAKVETKSMASMTDFKVNSDQKPWSLAVFWVGL